MGKQSKIIYIHWVFEVFHKLINITLTTTISAIPCEKETFLNYRGWNSRPSKHWDITSSVRKGVQKLTRFVWNSSKQRNTSNINKIIKESLFDAWIKDERIVLLKNLEKINVTNEFLAVYEIDKKRPLWQKPKDKRKKSILLINKKKKRYRIAIIIGWLFWWILTKKFWLGQDIQTK